ARHSLARHGRARRAKSHRRRVAARPMARSVRKNALRPDRQSRSQTVGEGFGDWGLGVRQKLKSFDSPIPNPQSLTPFSTMRLHNKAVLVTGSTTGIGEAIARRAVAEGARVLIHGRDERRGRTLVAEMQGRAAFHQDDIADPAAPARMIAAAIDAFGRLDALVNNAASVQRSNL